MPSYYVRETFFRPDTELRSEASTIPASICNDLQLLLSRVAPRSLFVPIRSMQYLAVADREEIVFIDAQGGYAHRNGEGGRLIRIAWRPDIKRESLYAPVFCEMVYYFDNLTDVQSRLLGAIGPALRDMLAKGRTGRVTGWDGKILPFRRDDPS